MSGGEIFIPRIPSTLITDLARAVAPDAQWDVVGIRSGEKLHEEMVSENDARRTYAFDDHYVIAPMLEGWGESSDFGDAKLVPDGFFYRSDTNDLWLGVEEISELIASLQ
jgi:UDP-N-acetylglucosamine 4,6-dehydratase/5-epimerase